MQHTPPSPVPLVESLVLLRKKVWPMKTQCSRVEQRLLAGLRLLDPSGGDHEQGRKVLLSIGIVSDDTEKFIRLHAALKTGQLPLRLLGSGASFVTDDELDLLACLHRLSHNKSVEARLSSEGEQRANSFLFALHECAAVLHTASLTLRQRTLPNSGRRIIEHENVTSRSAANMMLRPVTVTRIRKLSPHMRRMTLRGEDIPGFIAGQAGRWVKLFLTNAIAGAAFIGRAYTVRNYRPDVQEFDIDFVLHGNGPMSRWAAVARVGQHLHVSGTRGGFSIDSELPWILLAGDQAAFPAISVIMEALPANVAVKVVLEVRDDAEMTALPSLASTDVQFVASRAGGRTAPGRLLDIIRATELPDGPGQIWVAAEAAVARAVREHLLIDRLIPAKRIHSVAYWKRGEQDHADMAAG